MAKDIKRGEIYWVDWNPGRGSEQSGLRPALVIQNDIGKQIQSNYDCGCADYSHREPYPS